MTARLTLALGAVLVALGALSPSALDAAEGISLKVHHGVKAWWGNAGGEPARSAAAFRGPQDRGRLRVWRHAA